ncbi:MAG TPA: class I SAM-dependent methyltransferase [Chryseolinea sp.]
MTKLYTTYAELYHKMYQSFIDYDEEYEFYRGLLHKCGKQDILEVGCGTGQLARRFITDGYRYMGIDVSDPMLEIAKKEMPSHHFCLMDMRAIDIAATFEAVVITARSISYILTNADVMATFKSVKNVLKDGGVVIFDFIDANRFIPAVKENEVISHDVVIDNIAYKRESIFQKRIDTSWNWLWKSTFMKEENGKYEEIGSDEAELRTFTTDELRIFLTLAGFEIIQVLDRKVYAFDTKVIVARKRNDE